MAHFAELDKNNIVLRVIVVANETILDADGVEQESIGVDFCKQLFGGVDWKQTSYNATFRKNFAGHGFKYSTEMDAFIPPRPFPSWVFNAIDCRWNPPVKRPDVSGYFDWDEETLSWVSRSQQ